MSPPPYFDPCDDEEESFEDLLATVGNAIAQDPILGQVVDDVYAESTSTEATQEDHEQLLRLCLEIETPPCPPSTCAPSPPSIVEISSDNNAIDKDKICAVCSACASGFRYYGAVVCNSCRAFFTRANRKEAHKKFTCSGGGNNDCAVRSKSWRSCQRCRFEKCLNAGMGVNKMRAARRQKAPDTDVAALTRQMESKLSLEDSQAIDAIVRSDQDFMMWESGKFYMRDLETMDLAMSMIFEGTPAPIKLHRDQDR